MVKAVVLDVDVDKERISLGIKQLTKDPFQEAISGLKRGVRVTCVVKEVTPTGIEVATTDGVTGFIRKAELSRDRVEQRPDRFAVGEKLDAKVTNIDNANRRVTLSIKALEIEDEKQAMADLARPTAAPAWATSSARRSRSARSSRSRARTEWPVPPGGISAGRT